MTHACDMFACTQTAVMLWVGITIGVLVGVFAALTAAAPDIAHHDERGST